ncbi:hypothetical protein WJX82_007631 [Trebouxia sp. C0006]
MVAVSTVDGATVNLLHLAGNSGPLVLFLHANGFHIKCYTPLAEHFAKHNYQCWGVEFRGQGSLPAPPGNLVDLYLSDLFAVVDSLSLRGCLAFTHSGGAQVAVRAEALRPGTFAAIYAFEPVLFPVEIDSRTGKHSSEGYEALAALARRRKSHFKSKQEAVKRFRSRPPFSAFHTACFEEYVAHGLSEQADGTCVLAISPESEARWYNDAGSAAMGSGHDDPPNVQCPITIGVGANAEGPVDYLNTEGVKQAPRFPKGRSDCFEGLAHLGPLEDPIRVASRAMACFQASKGEAAWLALTSAVVISAAHARL